LADIKFGLINVTGEVSTWWQMLMKGLIFSTPIKVESLLK